MTVRLAMILCVALVAPELAAANTLLHIESGTRPDGRPSALWLDAIRVFHDDQSLRDLSASEKRRTGDETAWADLITARAAIWPEQYENLLIPFPNTIPPGEVTIVLGNQGGNDAFVYGEVVIAIDLARMLDVYGLASKPENVARIDRFFAHEYTHILHKAWQRQVGLEISSPLEQALWACLKEGLGNYRSLSSRWLDENRRLTERSIDTLNRLQPVFTDRIARLENASDDEVAALVQGLSLGPFDQKWGGLTVALWLAREAEHGDEQLAFWVDQGPWGVIDLAQKHLPADLASRLPSRPSR